MPAKSLGMMSSNTSRTARAAIALKSGVVMGGTAILSAVNGLTPHMAGAIDIMVVQQPDGTLKCSPFYVRFGKYTPMRSKDKKVHILINGEEAAFQMHLGAYGQAYFAAETMEVVSDADDDELLQGMMSPPSGYSSDEDAPYANEEILSAVQQEVQRIKDKQQEQAHTVPGSQPSPEAAAAAAKAPAGSKALHRVLSGEAVDAEPGETGSDNESSSGLDDMPSASEITAAVQKGIAGGQAGGKLRVSRHRSSSSPEGVDGPLGIEGSNMVTLVRSSSRSSGSSRQHRRHRQHRTRIVLDAPGDGAAADPARTNLQDLLLDNRYSLKVKSDDSFTADGHADGAQLGRQINGKSHLQQQQQRQQPGRLEDQQQHEVQEAHKQTSQEPLDGVQEQPQQKQHEEEQSAQQVQQHQHQQQQPHRAAEKQLQQQGPVRHVGFEVAASPLQPKGHNTVRRIQQGELAGALDSSASYSIDEVSGLTSAVSARPGGAASPPSSEASVDGPAAAVVSAAIAAVIAANEAVPAAAAAAAAAQDTSPEAAAASKAVAAANAAVKAQALAAMQQNSNTAAAAESDGLYLAAMPTLTDGIAASEDKKDSLSQQQRLGLLKAGDNLLASNENADRQHQQPCPQMQQETAPCSSSSSDMAAAPEAGTVAIVGSGVESFAGSRSAAEQHPLMRDASAPVNDMQPHTPRKPSTASVGPAVSTAPPTAVGPGSLPLSVPGILAASPPVESGYLGDIEHERMLGTSYDSGATPRVAGPADQIGSGPLALGLAGFQLSLCGHDLRADMLVGEAQQVFEAGRVSAQAWSERGITLLEDPNLVVKIGGSLYSWQVAAPMVVGMLAFGGKWDGLLGLDATGMYPIKVAEDHSSTTKKASSSWRLWPFTGWRETTGSTKSLPAPGSSPSPAMATAGSASKAASGQDADRASAGGLSPSGGSFSNLLSLMGPGSKSAPASAGLESPADAADGIGSAALEGASPRATVGGASLLSTASSPARPLSRKKHIIIIRKTLTPTSDQLSLLPLKPGANTITFRASGATDLTAYIYLLRWNTRLVVSDVDGTITRSDLLGHVLPTLGVDWSHPGITQLFHNIDRNGYQIMFLSSRAIAQANITREYLHSLVQDGHKMPSGPVIISPHGLLPSLYREIVVRRPHEFKIACLQDIRALFPPEWNPFYGGFGNRDTDEVSYKVVGVPVSRTFTINPKGQIQKASMALQSSTWSSLSAINGLVDEIFPPLPAAATRSNGRALRQQQSSSATTTDWELAAAAGIIGEEMLAAVIAERERRRSSGSTGDAHTAAGAPAGTSSSDNNKADEQAQEGKAGAAGLQDRAAPVANIVADATAAAAAGGAAAAYSTSYASSSSSRVGRREVPELEVEDVGPAREEFSDLQYWKTSVTFSVDIEQELKQLEKSQQQQQQQLKR